MDECPKRLLHLKLHRVVGELVSGLNSYVWVINCGDSKIGDSHKWI